MTKAELIKALEALPDDGQVFLVLSDGDELATLEVVQIVGLDEGPEHPPFVALGKGA